MRFSNVLVTGGAGFIGGSLARCLRDNGVKVGIMDNFARGGLPHSFTEKDFRIHSGDVRDTGLVTSIVNGYEAVLHQAALVGISDPFHDSTSLRETNVTGTLNLLKAATESNVDSFIFASSAAVYGNASDFPLREESATSPCSDYGRSKLEGEKNCQRFADQYGLRTICLRYFNVYGPGQKPGSRRGVVANFCEKLLRGESPVICGDGEQTRDFVHVTDVVQANILALDSKASPGSVFNVCTGRPTSINDLVLKLCHAMGREGVDPTYGAARPGDIMYSCGDFGKAQRVLGYEPMVGLEHGIEELVREMKLAEPVTVRP